MCKGKFFCVQGKPAERADRVSYIDISDGFVAALVVDLVAHDRMINICHVNAYLVGAAGFYLDVEQCEFFVPLPDVPKGESTAAVCGDFHP